MVNLSTIMSLTEASTGFVNGNYVDEMPHLSLTECVNGMSLFLLESQIEAANVDMAANESLVESAISALTAGTQIDTDAILEASMGGLKARAKKIFDGIKQFIKTIIAKISTLIDKIRMDGNQLWTKYGEQVKKKAAAGEFSDMKFTGYKFPETNLFPGTDKYESNVESMILAINTKIEKPSEMASEENKDVIKKCTEAITDMDKAARVSGMVKVLTGKSDLSEGGWRNELKEAIYGDKTELDYGKDGFSVDAVGSVLQKPVGIEKIKDEYKRLGAAVEKYSAQIKKELDDLEKKDVTKGLEGENATNASALKAARVSHFEAYLSLVTDAYNVINVVKNIKLDYEKARAAQAKSMLGKMISYKKKKDTNDASNFDGIEMFEL